MSPNCGTQSYRIYCKRQGPCGNYCLAVRNGCLILAVPNNCDSTQLWYKQSSNCGFMLVNRCSNRVIRYGCAGDQLQLVCKPSCPQSCVLWTECGDRTCGYGYIRTQSNCNYVMDAWTGIINDGLRVSIYSQQNSDNQFWKLVRC
ncbi:hypothetical protein KSS87_013838 [Heliosperma pusillum]|nr:hypothetical protein KSS87_008752 [Heliosperma pusillum]KAH9622995.1 hypothetical protein KSS87_013836 [Heliosperma pusillum]KAH9622996.1 hypothetical protein KSS87_013837 [Heliosperma pusillum]KAH9622997.1 hypothetical protein KSS87_013838 [Heliosperma pusillum]